MIRFILFLFAPFRWFIERMGADYNQFITLLKLKLTIDDRNLKRSSAKPGQNNTNALLMQSVTQIFIGAMFALFLYIVKSPFTYYYFAHTFIMAMMAMMIISEFTTILFDTSENAIIQPLPIKGNTISLARNAHVFVYLSLMAFNLSCITLILAISKFGIISGVIFLFTITLNVMFTLFLANILYLSIMRLASGEQLKNLLMYFQIAVAILFMAGYQFGLKLVDQTVFENMILPVHWYTFLVPPAFFSGFIESFTTLHFDLIHVYFILEAILIPAIAIYITGKYLTPVFNSKLMALEQGDRNSKVKTSATGNGLLLRIALALFVSGNEEKAAFKLMWKMTGRERLFLQTLLPTYGYIIIMIVLPFFTRPTDTETLVKSDKYLFLLYTFLFVAATLPGALLTGNNRSAAWIFKSFPLSSPAELFKGFINAAFSRFFLPLYIVVSIIVCFIWGLKIIPDVIIVLMSIYLFTLLFYNIQQPWFPFSQEKSASKGGTVFIRALAILMPAVAVGFFHKFLLHWHDFSNLLLIPLYGGAIFYVNRVMVYRKVTWKAVDRVNVY
jgi:ABC-2 type transport system permease protein